MSNKSQSSPTIAAIEPDIAERLVSRRHAIARGATTSGMVMAGLRMASVPTALAALSAEAFGQGRLPAVVNGVLNFALRLEYLEAEFYNIGVATAGLIPAADRAIFETIRDHENVHVEFLRNALGASARPKPTFDFTAGNGSFTGPFSTVFTSYATFTAVAQAFEDTGVRAYKGQAPALKPYKDTLTAALTIHSVEARHAAEVRRLRGNFSDNEPNEGWITNAITDIPGTEAVYAGEDNVVHLGINVATLMMTGVPAASGVPRAPAIPASGISAKEVTESFDEPLTMAQVLAIVDPFIV